MDRNFIVVYVASFEAGWLNGSMQFTTNGSYLNKEITLKQIQDNL